MMLYLLFSVLAGAVLMMLTVMWAMRNFMISKYLLDASFDEVCQAVEASVKSVPGWGHPLPDWDFHSSVSKTHYFDRLKRKRIFFVCKAEYANRIVDRYHHMGAMMPCTWSIYETSEGQVYLSKLNIGLMSKVFMGNVIGQTMGLVAREEHQMLKQLRQHLKGLKG